MLLLIIPLICPFFFLSKQSLLAFMRPRFVKFLYTLGVVKYKVGNGACFVGLVALC